MEAEAENQYFLINEDFKLNNNLTRSTAKLQSLFALLDELGWMVASEDPSETDTFCLRGKTQLLFDKDRICRHELMRYFDKLEERYQLHNGSHLIVWRNSESSPRRPIAPLSKRETEIYHLLLAGLTLPDMAEELGISQRTVEKHVENVYKKKGVHSYNELLFQTR